MKVKTHGSRLDSIRLIGMVISILTLTAWALISRTSAGSSLPPGPSSDLREGFAAPDFTLDTLDGGQLTLSELRGHPVVLNLWATWCMPCREEMPSFEKIYQRYEETGLVVIGLNLTFQDSIPEVSAFVQELGLTFPIVLDRDGSVSARYRLVGLPSTFFIDRNGILRAVIIGGPMSEAAIQSNVEDLLRE